MDIDNDNDDINFDWIDDFNKDDENYKIFYKNIIDILNINIIYINTDNEIEKITREKLKLKTNNILSKEELIYIIKKNITPDNNSTISLRTAKYKLLSILLYNVTVEPKDINKNNDNNYLKTVNYLNDIVLENTIEYFKNLNTIYILFYENKNSPSYNKTKRISINKVKKTRRTRP